MSKNLTELRVILEQDQFKNSDVVYILLLTRKLLEENNTKPKAGYPTLTLYTDWAAHWAIERNEECVKCLYQLTEILTKLRFLKTWKDDGNGGMVWNADEALCEAVNMAIGLPTLRNELVKFVLAYNLPVDIFQDDKKWFRFADLTVRILLEQVIKFPDDMGKASKEIKKIYHDIQLKSKNNKELQVIRFSILHRHQIPEEITKNRDSKFDIFFQMDTQSGHYFVGPFWVIA